MLLLDAVPLLEADTVRFTAVNNCYTEHCALSLFTVGNVQSLTVVNKFDVLFFHSVLCHCWLGDRKGIWPIKCWVLVCWWS